MVWLFRVSHHLFTLYLVPELGKEQVSTLSAACDIQVQPLAGSERLLQDLTADRESGTGRKVARLS